MWRRVRFWWRGSDISDKYVLDFCYSWGKGIALSIISWAVLLSGHCGILVGWINWMSLGTKCPQGKTLEISPTAWGQVVSYPANKNLVSIRNIESKIWFPPRITCDCEEWVTCMWQLELNTWNVTACVFFFCFPFWMKTAGLANNNFVKLGFTTRPASHTLKGGLLGIWTRCSAIIFCVSCTHYASDRCTAAEN